VATLHKNVLRICLEKQNLVYYEACLSDIDAYKREKYLKTRLGKNFIKKRLNNWFRIHASARTNAVQGWRLNLKVVFGKIVRCHLGHHSYRLGMYKWYLLGNTN